MLIVLSLFHLDFLKQLDHIGGLALFFFSRLPLVALLRGNRERWDKLSGGLLLCCDYDVFELRHDQVRMLDHCGVVQLLATFYEAL